MMSVLSVTKKKKRNKNRKENSEEYKMDEFI